MDKTFNFYNVYKSIHPMYVFNKWIHGQYNLAFWTIWKTPKNVHSCQRKNLLHMVSEAHLLSIFLITEV